MIENASRKHSRQIAKVTGVAYLGGTIVYHGGAGIESELLSQEVLSKHHHGDSGHGASLETHSESSHEHSEGDDQHKH